MADWFRRERVTKHTEYVVPFGYVGELYKCLAAAYTDYCRTTGKDPDGFMYDDWAKFSHDDEHIIVSFEVAEVKP